MSRLRRACQCSQSVRAPLHAEETRRHAHVNNSARKEVGGLAVRRLTPRLRECERLQGMPDDHTRWRADGSEIPDGPRYRMVGNSVAVPVLAWIAQRIAPVLAGGPP
jgi:DNA (cytosine-5)-methyltransferase 1